MLAAAQPILPIAASPALIERGCVQVIGLEEIRDEIGERWEKRKETVWAHLEGLLSQKLGPTDFYVQIDDTSFLVSMPTAQEQEAQIFCLRVAHDLHGSLLGRCDTEKLRIARVISVKDGDIETALVSGEVLHALAGKAGLHGPAPAESPHKADRIETPFAQPVQYHHGYLPMWDAQREAITTYRCVTRQEQSAAESPGRAPRLELAMAISRIAQATRCLTAHLAAGERFMMWIPLSYEVLSSAVGRMEIAGICRNLSADLRPYLIFEICDLPQGVPQSRLSELVGSLRPFCRGVAAQVPPRTTNYSAYLGAGLQAIGLSVAGGLHMELADDLVRLSQAVKKKQMLTFVLGLPRGELLQAARALGIHLLSSPVIGPCIQDPAPVRRLSAVSLAEEPVPARMAV